MAVECYEPPLQGRAQREPPLGLAALQQSRESSPVSPRKAGGGMAGGGGSPRERKTPKSPSWAIVEGQSPSSPTRPQSNISPKATTHDAATPANSAQPSAAPPLPSGGGTAHLPWASGVGNEEARGAQGGWGAGPRGLRRRQQDENRTRRGDGQGGLDPARDFGRVEGAGSRGALPVRPLRSRQPCHNPNEAGRGHGYEGAWEGS